MGIFVGELYSFENKDANKVSFETNKYVIIA